VQGTAQQPAETEPNDEDATANPLGGGTLGWTTSLCPAGDVDVFTTAVVPGSWMEIGLDDGLGGCTPLASQLHARVRRGALVIAQDESAGCLALDPDNQPALADLLGGDVLLEIDSGNDTLLPLIGVSAAVHAPLCGDGYTQEIAGEACDDGNMDALDGCSSDCQLEAGCFEDEPNDRFVQANFMDGCSTVIGAIEPLGDTDWFSFEVTPALAGASIVAETTDGSGVACGGFDSWLTLYDRNGVELAMDDNDGDGGCSRIAPELDLGAQNLAPGHYTLLAQHIGNAGTFPDYRLLVSIVPPVCGDLILHDGEQCDDGATADGDGCSATCQLEGIWCDEVEPNGDLAAATVVSGCDGALGAILPVADEDWFTFDVPVATTVTLATGDGLGGCPLGFDSTIELFDDGGMSLGVDDDLGADKCSLLSVPVGPGLHTVRVEEYGDNEPQAHYVLSIGL
jgi:cysteine-rich repeat protein